MESGWLTHYSYTTNNIAHDDIVTYHPRFKNGHWCIGYYRSSLREIAKKCNIPEDEVLILKLKYGG